MRPNPGSDKTSARHMLTARPYFGHLWRKVADLRPPKPRLARRGSSFQGPAHAMVHPVAGAAEVLVQRFRFLSNNEPTAARGIRIGAEAEASTFGPGFGFGGSGS